MNLSHYATFDLQERQRVQIVTYEDVSVCEITPLMSAACLSNFKKFLKLSNKQHMGSFYAPTCKTNTV